MIAITCAGTTSAGKPCKNKVEKKGELCHLHKKTAKTKKSTKTTKAPKAKSTPKAEKKEKRLTIVADVFTEDDIQVEIIGVFKSEKEAIKACEGPILGKAIKKGLWKRNSEGWEDVNYEHRQIWLLDAPALGHIETYAKNLFPNPQEPDSEEVVHHSVIKHDDLRAR